MKWTSALGGSLFLVTVSSLTSCAPEGEQKVSLDSSGEDACAQLSTTLASGIKTGDDLVVLFNCVNSSGQLDAFEPVITALNTSTDSAGVPLLDRWVEVLKSQAGSIDVSGGSSVSASDVSSGLDQLEAYLNSGAPEVQLALIKEAIDYRVVASGITFGGAFGSAMAELGTDGSNSELRNWLLAAQDILCHEGAPDGQCDSPLRDYLRGTAYWAAQWDPANPDAYIFSTGPETREMLDWLLYAGGDSQKADEANEGLARALAALGAPVAGVGPSVLQRTMGVYLPSLFGDDPNTPYVYEGYPDRNAGNSAVYGLMETLADPTIVQAMAASGDQGYQLASRYYVWDGGDRGVYEPYHTDTCVGAWDDEAGLGTVNSGFDQLIRILVAADVDYTDNPNCEATMAILIPQVAPYFQLSNTKNLGALMLEIFASLPIEGIQAAVNILNNPLIVQVANALCNTKVQLDDTEALQASVYMEETMSYALPLISSVVHAGKTEELVHMMTEVWGTPALCELGPTLRLTMDPSAPGGDGGVSPLLPDPDAVPGQNPHDMITLPMLTMTMDVARHADVLLPPLAQSLVEGEGELSPVLNHLGEMAHQPGSALNDMTLVKSEKAKKAGDYSSLASAAALLDSPEVAEVLFLTLADAGVQSALINVDPASGYSPLTFLSEKIGSGTFNNYLDLLRALLADAQTQMDAGE